MMGGHGCWAGPEAPVPKFQLTLWKPPWPVGVLVLYRWHWWVRRARALGYRLPLCLRAWLRRSVPGVRPGTRARLAGCRPKPRQRKMFA